MDIKEQKIADIRKEMNDLISLVERESEGRRAIHEVELKVFRELLKVGLSLLKYYIMLVSFNLTSKDKLDSQGNTLENKGSKKREYFSIFGQLSFMQTKYYSVVDKTCYPLSKALNLPRGIYSYLLQDWMSYGAVDLDFQQSVDQLERILGHCICAEQSSRITYKKSKDVSAFYEQKDWTKIEDGTHLSLGLDGKGIRIRRSETDRAAENTVVRLGRGENRNTKKEATVSVTSSFTPKVRCSKDLIDSLFLVEKEVVVEKKKKCHEWHEQKHIRAFLSAKKEGIRYGIENLIARDCTSKKRIVILVDGDRSLEKSVKEIAEEKGITNRIDAYVLDFIHLLEYVWKVANAYMGETDVGRENWVKRQASLLLNSNYKKVLQEWKNIEEYGELSKTHLYNVQRGITYLSNHSHMVDYKAYLEKGYPITTGAVESACGHFVKARMEKAAMHWGKQGAQDMLDIRAAKKNNNWEEYMTYSINNEQSELYGNVA